MKTVAGKTVAGSSPVPSAKQQKEDPVKNKDWNNFCMRKYGNSIRVKIIEAYEPFAKATILSKKNKVESLKNQKPSQTIH